MAHKLPELPYPKDALAPMISAETLDYHHGKHHRAYVDNLNGLIAGTRYESMSLEETIRASYGQPSERAVFNNAAQAYNHTFYWSCLSPRGGGAPTGALAAAIDAAFGDFATFKDKLSRAAIGQFGSGWAWLVKTADGGLAIETTANADTPLAAGKTNILTIDVWEHAYYIDYRNARAKYVEAFWRLVDWEFANRSLA